MDRLGNPYGITGHERWGTQSMDCLADWLRKIADGCLKLVATKRPPARLIPIEGVQVLIRNKQWEPPDAPRSIHYAVVNKMPMEIRNCLYGQDLDPVLHWLNQFDLGLETEGEPLGVGENATR